MDKPMLQDYIRPTLVLFQDGRIHSYEELFGLLGEQSDLIRRDIPRRLTLMLNAALGYLMKARVLESPSKQAYQITERGRELLCTAPSLITVAELRQYPEFEDFIRSRYKKSDVSTPTAVLPTALPEDAIEEAYRQYNNDLADRLLLQIKQCSWQFFEVLVKDLLMAMGYGDSHDECLLRRGAGDGGIDGVIKADPLGLDVICIQAKKWDQSVGRPDIQKFAGSLESGRAKKGVFITTSSFSAEAQDYVERIEKRIVLIDGPRLARLMIDYGIGVSDSSSYTLKIIDSDYFGSRST